MARVTSWTDQGMDWTNPNLTNWRYVDALSKAVNEREAALGWTPTALPDFEGRHLSKTILQDIRNKVRTLIPYFINHTVTPLTYDDAVNEVSKAWTINSISEITKFGEITFENSGMSVSTFNEYAKRLYQTINLLRYIPFDISSKIKQLTVKSEIYGGYETRQEDRWTKTLCGYYGLPHTDIFAIEPGTGILSGFTDYVNTGLLTDWKNAGDKYWNMAAWGDRDMIETPCSQFFTLNCNATSAIGTSLPRIGKSAFTYKAKIKIETDKKILGIKNDFTLIAKTFYQIWEISESVKKYEGWTHGVIEDTTTVNDNHILIESGELNNGSIESSYIEMSKLTQPPYPWWPTTYIEELYGLYASKSENVDKVFEIKKIDWSCLSLNFAFKDW